MDREKLEQDQAALRASALTNSVNQVDLQNPSAAAGVSGGGAAGGGTVGLTPSTSGASRSSSAFGAPGGTGIIPPGGPLLQPSSISPSTLGRSAGTSSGITNGTSQASPSGLSSTPASKSAATGPATIATPGSPSSATNAITPNP